MKIVIKHPGKPAFVDEIPETDSNIIIRHIIGLKSLALGISQLIKSYQPGLPSVTKAIEPPWICTAILGKKMFGNDDLVVYADDDSISKKLPLNFYRPTDQHPVKGTVVAVKVDVFSNNLNMTDDEAKEVMTMLDTLSNYSDNLDKHLN